MVLEGQLTLTAPFQKAKQTQIENLEELRVMRCESDHAHTGSREKFDDSWSEVT
jgi:hypothetical protein